jgi:hypothetical protein
MSRRIGKSCYDSSRLIKILHIFRADPVILYPVPNQNGEETHRPLMVSDGNRHFVIIAPLEAVEEKQDVQDEAMQDVASSSEDPQHAETATTNDDSNLERHKRILELREQGKSYCEIGKELTMPKSSAAAEVAKHSSSTCICAR